MSRKDYHLVAWSLHRLGNKSHNWQAVMLTADALATSFAVDNFRFDRGKFMQVVEFGIVTEKS